MSNTVVGADTHIESGIRGKDEILIEGRVDGPIAGESKVILAAGAQIGGDVSGSEVTIGCVLRHKVVATQSVRLLPTAEVFGDISAPRIVIDDGAVLEGQVKITRAPAKTTAAADDRRKSASPMRQIAAPAPPEARTIPELPALGRRVAQRRK